MKDELKDQYAHSAIIIPVRNILSAIDYYEKNLGFEVTFRWGNPISYAVGRLGAETHLHFTESSDKGTYGVSLYIFVKHVDSVYEALKHNKVKIVQDIGDREYGMRDFDIIDLNGFRLTFASSIDRLTE